MAIDELDVPVLSTARSGCPLNTAGSLLILHPIYMLIFDHS